VEHKNVMLGYSYGYSFTYFKLLCCNCKQYGDVFQN